MSGASEAAVDEAGFRAAMGSFATGVSVMTSELHGGPHGMTANAVSSVSLDPPLVLVCVDRGALMAGAVRDTGWFALSFLAEDQAELSDRFADPDRPEGEAGFAGVDTSTARTGARIVDRAAGWVDCEVHEILDGGDHHIVVGRAVAVGDSSRAPLLYTRGAYGALRPD